MKKAVVLLFLAVLWLGFGCTEKQPQQQHPPAFTVYLLLKTTPVKQQGNRETCWLYALLATIETDRLEQGDSVNLSPAFLERLLLRQNATDCYFGTPLSQLHLSNVAPNGLRLLAQYGVVPYDSYPSNESLNLPVLQRKVAQMAHRTAAQKAGLQVLNERVDCLLDDEMGALAPHVYMYGAQYSPQEFARSVCKAGTYKAYTSFTHHPFGADCRLEVPDNTSGEVFKNIPLDSLMHLIEGTLQARRAVCWEGCTPKSEFSFARGTAILSPKHGNVTQAGRQRAFERFETTDQHVLCLVGMAHDAQGNRYFIAKNSWGVGNPFHGFMYLSYAFIRQRTVAVVCLNP